MSYIANRWFRRQNRSKMNKILVIIIGCLTGTSALSMIVNIIISFNTFGVDYMMDSAGLCD